MGAKAHPNRRVYVEALRAMTPDERLSKAFELTDMARRLLLDGLRHTFPDASDEEIRLRYLERLDRCHNRPC